MGSSIPMQPPRVLIDHRDVEFEVVADQRPRADEAQELRQDLLYRSAAGHVALAQAMDLDRLCLHSRAGSDHRLEPRARKNPGAANGNGGDGHDVVPKRIEPGRFAVDCDRFLGGRLVEQEAKRRVAQEMLVNAPLDREPHQNMARLKWRRTISRSRFVTWKASRRRSRSMVDSSAGLTRLVEALSAIWASSRMVMR